MSTKAPPSGCRRAPTGLTGQQARQGRERGACEGFLEAGWEVASITMACSTCRAGRRRMAAQQRGAPPLTMQLHITDTSLNLLWSGQCPRLPTSLRVLTLTASLGTRSKTTVLWPRGCRLSRPHGWTIQGAGSDLSSQPPHWAFWPHRCLDARMCRRTGRGVRHWPRFATSLSVQGKMSAAHVHPPH